MRKLSVAAGFSLVEVTLALGIGALCLITVFGLVPVAALTNRNATSQTAATNITAGVIADVRATPPTVFRSAQYGINLPGNPGAPPDPAPCSGSQTLYFNAQAQATSTISPDSRYRLTVTFVRNPINAISATYVRLKVSWPAAMDPCTTAPAGSLDTFAGFDRN
jgi:type II secretory pathway pseudopilin PulG